MHIPFTVFPSLTGLKWLHEVALRVVIIVGGKNVLFWVQETITFSTEPKKEDGVGKLGEGRRWLEREKSGRKSKREKRR